jgi:anaerobic magnesium-protoporphyrin IX monomethyl ester cyclase
MKLITYFYTPTPQRRGTYGNVDPLSTTPATLEEWVTPEWAGWMTHEDPLVPWLPRKLKERVEDFARNLKGGLVPSDSQAYGHLRPPA